MGQPRSLAGVTRARLADRVVPYRGHSAIRTQGGKTVDLRGKMCILHPFSAGGAVLPQNVNFNLIAQSFHGAIAAELAKAGLDVRMPVPGAPDQGIVMRGQFVKADPGKRWMRYFLTWLPGAAAVMEVEGWVADGDVPVTQFHSVGKRNIG